jgi:hypothetical protein
MIIFLDCRWADIFLTRTSPFPNERTMSWCSIVVGVLPRSGRRWCARRAATGGGAARARRCRRPAEALAAPGRGTAACDHTHTSQTYWIHYGETLPCRTIKR